MKKFIKILYKNILKPILFLFPADYIHKIFLKLGFFLGRFKILKFITNKLFNYKNKSLEQNVLGINFKNPVGLAAGFDYDADLPNILGDVGFGYESIGTVTHDFYAGNTFPMLNRLPKSKSLLVNKGFKSNGIEKVLNKIKKSKKSLTVGISIGTTNKKYESEEEMVENFYEAFKKAITEKTFDYFEINISCPNLVHLPENFEKFDTVNGLIRLLDKISNLEITKPVFIKMHCEKSVEETLNLCEVAKKYNFILGFVFSNLVKDRNNSKLDKNELEKFKNHKGNFSGKPTQDLADNLISEVYKKYKNEKKEDGSRRFILIGCGGIFDGKDAYEKIKRGATLVQMITGMIYEGPSQIGIINKELVEFLKEDGYKNISEAVGSYYK